MTSPFRSRIAPRGGGSGTGRSRLDSARSWYFSCWMICARKKAPASTRKRDRDDPARAARPPLQVGGIQVVHCWSSRMRNQPPNSTSSTVPASAVVSAWSGASISERRGEPLVARAARHQHDQVAQPDGAEEEAGVDQHVVGEEEGPRQGRQVAHQGVGQGRGPEPRRAQRVARKADQEAGQRARAGPAPQGEEHQADHHEVGRIAALEEPRTHVELEEEQQPQRDRQLQPVGRLGAGHRAPPAYRRRAAPGPGAGAGRRAATGPARPRQPRRPPNRPGGGGGARARAAESSASRLGHLTSDGLGRLTGAGSQSSLALGAKAAGMRSGVAPCRISTCPATLGWAAGRSR